MLRKSPLILTTFLLCFINFALVQSSKTQISEFLLKHELEALNYDLDFTLNIQDINDPENTTFLYCKERIFLKAIKSDVQNLILHSSVHIKIQKASLIRQDLPESDVKPVRFNNVTQMVTFSVEPPLKENEELYLKLEYVLQLKQALGFYMTHYLKNNEKRWLFFTDFEPAYARTVFPCLDEPRYKSYFNVSVSIPLFLKGYHVLMNTPLEKEVTGESYKTFYFKKNEIPMTTYILAIVISEYVATNPTQFVTNYPSPRKGPLRIWAEESELAQSSVKEVQRVTGLLIDLYNNEFGIGYGFEKLDQIALHNYPVAMENWGLIKYKTSFLNYSEATVRVISHELAHQWFGNLITCHWWSDVWLNEGFAKYYEYFGSAKLSTEDAEKWNFPVMFITNIFLTSMILDVPEYSNHPLTVNPHDPLDFYSYFDVFAYGKGASVLYMWMNIFGEEVFSKAIRHYLSTHRNKVVTPEDLLLSFDQFTNESQSDFEGMLPSKIFRAWHKSAGFPLVTISKLKRTRNKTSYILTQDVFRLGNDFDPQIPVWYVPITYSTNEDPNFDNTSTTYWLKPNETLKIEIPYSVKWIILNNGFTSYYRVNYDPDNWNALYKLLENPKTYNRIPIKNRVQILSDSFDLMKTSVFETGFKFGRLFSMLFYLQHEKERYAWETAFYHMQFIKDMLHKYDKVYPLYKEFVLDLIGDRFKKKLLLRGFRSSFNKNVLDSKIVNWGCEFDHPLCVSISDQLFSEYLRNKSSLSLHVMSSVFCSVTRNDLSQITGNLLWYEYEESKDFSTKTSLLTGLSCSNDRTIIRRVLDRAMNLSNTMPPLERAFIFTIMLKGNPGNRVVLLEAMLDNPIQTLYLLQKKYLKFPYLNELALGFGTRSEIKQLEKLRNMVRKSVLGRMHWKHFEKLVKIAQSNNLWLHNKAQSAVNWLMSKYGNKKQ